MNWKDTCLKMQMSKQFSTFQPIFYCCLLAGVWWSIQEFKYCNSCILQNQRPCRKIVSSSLRIAADPRLGPGFRGKAESFWSLLSRAEAQSHLYVTVMQIFLFLQPVTCNREETTEKKMRLVLHFKPKTVALPGNGANLVRRERCCIVEYNLHTKYIQ